MKRLYRLLLLFGMAIALTVLPALPLWSQSSKPATTSAKPVAVATNSIYTKVSCDQVSTVPGENKQDAPQTNSLFAPGTQEGKDYECGYLTVPEVHSQPQGKQIQVAIAIVKSTNPQPSEPLILFQGGPGGSSLDIFPALLSSPTDPSVQKLRAQRDLIAFEKRGNRYSKPPLNCPEYQELDSEDTPEDKAKELASLKACRDRLTREGVNLAAFNSVESAYDVAALAKALGYKRVNLYGVSYGTELVQNVMRQHPNIIRSVILDGIVPVEPSLESQYGVILNRLITQVDAACAADPDCKALYPDVKGTFIAAHDRLKQTPGSVKFVTTKGQIKTLKVTADDFTSVLFQMAYSSGAPFVLPALIDQAKEGNFTLLAPVLYLALLTGGGTTQGTYYSVKCSEDVPYAGTLEVKGLPTFAQDWGSKQLKSEVDKCKVWAVPALDPSARKPIISDTPALLLNGHFDPVTPPIFGQSVAKGLRNHLFVEFPANGHGAIGTPCAHSLVAEFLANPNQAPNTACVNEQKVQFITEKNTLIAPGTRWLGQSFFDLSWQAILRRVVLLLVLILFPVVWLGMMLVAWLHRRRSGKPSAPVPVGARWASWLGVLLSVLSLGWILAQGLAMGATLLSGHGDYGFEQLLIGIERKYAWIYFLPIGIALLSIGMLVFAILSWKQTYWGKARRFYYSFTAGVAIVYTLLLAAAGQLTVFL
ncbi:alpha/beta fold hydrolase [Scytonema sp. UIC 10036]|uniref:alpha/beta hydrolase n=1 Tax=Scytonema sp. UIC 10036 TaxID=2304196 RepID=UPI0012DAA8AA|nr:alpha/beta hydrolase [Scytonema sp. UIC 10036]MUG96928.1 alpha/beta fold hydrolase [Scytonema sp. UIC 10036]